ncbi:hypothetical protein [uncultured Draconibacterium sp.]|uniref:hypothetical protein n=1 Tax=uncultured Draconibacterium sp. TaxID=1573823 RepID=UPI003216854E
MKKLLLILIVFAAACSAPTNKTEFNQIEYFKSESKDRVFCIYTTSTDKEEISNYARTLMHTSGKTTIAFFYNEKAKRCKKPQY